MATASLRPDKDFSKEVDQQIPQAELLAKVRRHVPGLLFPASSTMTMAMISTNSNNAS